MGGFNIIKYSLKNLNNILEKIKNQENIHIVETIHFLENTERYYCSYDLTYRLLEREKPIDVEIQSKNKFKLYYDHPDSERYYLMLVIAISNMNEIRLITTYPKKKKVIK